MKRIGTLINFITTDIWRIRLKDLSRSKSFAIKLLRIVLLAFRGFDEDRCGMWASALTFYVLLSIVPILTLIFGIAEGFGFEKILERYLVYYMPGQDEIIMYIVDVAHKLLMKTKGSIITGFGVVFLLWIISLMLHAIERSFNEIWGIKRERSIHRKFTNYMAFIFICPILLISFGSATVYIKTHMPHITALFDFFGFITPMIISIIKILPMVIVWSLFTFMYLVMPNTKVRWVSGVIGGIIGGTLYIFVQWVFFLFQKQILTFNAIYGSFAVVPLFLIWLQISWLIVFFGAEISFAHQNVDMFEFDHDCLKASLYLKKILALRITHLILKRFVNSEKPVSATLIGDQLGIPIRLVRQLLFELVEGEILSEVRLERENETVYQPAQSPDKMTIHYVLDTWEKRGINSIPAVHAKETDGILYAVRSFEYMLKQSSDNKLLHDI